VPQTLVWPAPPQVSVPMQVPQANMPPHASLMFPQFFPCAIQLVGVQPQTLLVPLPPQV
jgi:hypothetical protein